MKRLALVCLTVAGCSSGGGSNGGPADLAVVNPGPSWSLNGTLAGFSLPSEFRSVEAHTLAGAGTILVQLSSRAAICDLLQTNPTCTGSGQLLSFLIGGAAPGTFTLVDKATVAAGQARMLFVDLDATCLENAMASARSGSLAVSANDVPSGGTISFTFDANTADGPVSGQVTAPACVF